MIETISDATTIIVNVNYFLTSQKLVRHITEKDPPPPPRVSIGTYLNTLHLNVIRLGAAIAGMAGPLEDGDCLPRALTPGVVDFVPQATYILFPARHIVRYDDI